MRLRHSKEGPFAFQSSFHGSRMAGPGRAILHGSSEFQLDSAIAALRDIHGIDVVCAAPQVAYRETLSRAVETDYTYRDHYGGAARFARVKLVVEPNVSAGGSSFESRVGAGAIPDAFVTGVETGIAAAMRSGVLAGFPVVDVKTILVDAAAREMQSSAPVFEIAAYAALRGAFRDGGSMLLEPIMTVQITAPEDALGSLTADLLGRNGQVLGHEKRGSTIVITASVPYSNLFGYANQLRSQTQGRGTCVLSFLHYRPVHPRCDNPPFGPGMAMRVASVARGGPSIVNRVMVGRDDAI